jgi:hypothetical protein
MTLHHRKLHFWLVRAVRLSRQNYHPGWDALLSKGLVEFVALLDGDADVCFSVLDQGWRCDTFVEER